MENFNEMTSATRSSRTIDDILKINLHSVHVNPIAKVYDSSDYGQMALIVRYELLELSWGFYNVQQEIVIPFKQIQKFRIADGKVYVQLLDGFINLIKVVDADIIGSLFQSKEKMKNPISLDFLKNAASLVFTPSDDVKSESVMVFGQIIKKFRFDKPSSTTKSENLCPTSTNRELGEKEPQMLEIDCVFVFRRFILTIPTHFTLEQLLVTIEHRVQTVLNRDRVFFVNKNHERINLEDDQDWQLAKLEVKTEKMKLELLLV
ncbi:11492_t:CDS:2 [Ambispora gerdemannii]|uniref:11492_t:CDS:1 n=1 Tax=Ambispora gerdemannii TaxID=144530 RepID=A0A9N8ZQF4_9GLOM|nr:11492_t:CDS:2 [Ambispora gerdemannii]